MERLWHVRVSYQEHQQGTDSMIDTTPFNTLVEILNNHDLPYDRDAIQAAFDDADSQAAIQAWMQKYLTPDTLLTKDEATL